LTQIIMKINTTRPDDNIFLQIMSGIDGMPESLYYLGELPKERPPAVAIVGSRKPTSYGKEVTYSLAYELSKKGVVIISGLALGIDGIAHQAALDAGGKTIAVLGNGLPDIYPRSHESLAKNIIKSGGLIVSEYGPGTPAMQHSFLRRNRIVSGLSDAIIVTEAASHSGTLNTAAHALEQGREIFAVPGNITSPLSSGCNHLLQQGALVALSASDVIGHIAPQLHQEQSVLHLGSTPEETAIIKLLQAGIRDGDELQRKSKLEPSKFSVALTVLELNDTVKALGANQWTLK
jgi:DNA processing protein